MSAPELRQSHVRDAPVPIQLTIVTAAALFAAALTFWVWSAIDTFTEDIPPRGDECAVPRGYIVMDEGDLLVGTESKHWLPFPQTVCEGEGISGDTTSVADAFGLVLALCAAVAAGWGSARAIESDDYWDGEDSRF